MAPRTTRVYDREIDAKNPLYAEAEERVLYWLQSQRKEVRDVREARTYYDFVLGDAWTLDVKTDMRAHETGRVVWEAGVLNKSRQQTIDGWGMHHGLSYVAYVMPREVNAETAHESWPMLLVNAQRLREAVQQAVSDGKVGKEEVLKPFTVEGEDRVSWGYAVSLKWLRDKGLVLAEDVV